MTPLLQGAADYIREIAAMLDEAGIQATTGPLPTQWGARAWLAVASPDLQRARQLYEAHLDRMVGDERALQHVRAADAFDFEAEKTTCPACLTEFATAGVDSCPECGLRFRS